MKVVVLLADKGTQSPAQGTLNLLNVGWMRTTLQPPDPLMGGMVLTPPHAVAIFFEVEPRHCNHPIPLLVDLVTDDGHLVEVPGPAGPQAMRIEQSVTVPSPGGVPTGSPGVGNTLVEIGSGIPLAPGTYEWRISLAGEHEAHWNARFYVVPLPEAPVTTVGLPPTSE